MIKFAFRWGFRALILLIVLVVAALLLKNAILKSALEARLTRSTGLETRIGALDVALFSPTVTIENCRIYNTPEFGGAPFLNIEELHVELDRQALFYRELDIKLIRLKLTEANHVKNQKGVSNLRVIQQNLQKQANATPGNSTNKTNKSSDDGFKFLGVGTLNLTLGTIRDIDLRQPQLQRAYPLNMQNRVFNNLRTVDDVMTNLMPVLMKHGVEAAFAAPVPTNAVPARPAGK